MYILCVETRAKNNDKFLVASLFCFQNGQSRSEEEDETVDVESYGDETTAASSAMNLASQNNNNNITKIDSIRPTMRPMPFPGTNIGGGIGIGGTIGSGGSSNTNSSMPNDDHLITSRNSIWQTHTKHGHRLGTSPPGAMGATNLSLANSIPSIGCGPPPPPSILFSSESGATPTSSDQINDYDRAVDSPNRTMSTPADRLNAVRTINEMQKNCSGARELKNSAETTHNSCDNDNDEEVIVTNDDDECHKKMPSTKDLKRSDKNRYANAIHDQI